MESEKQISEFILSTLGETKAFVVEQAPEVIQQVLGYNMAMAILGMIGGFLLSCLSIWLYKKGESIVSNEEYVKQRDWDDLPHIIVPCAVTGLISFPLFLFPLSEFIHIYFYPKAYLLSQFL